MIDSTSPFSASPPTWLGQEAAARLLDRLEWLRLQPQRILWVGEESETATVLLAQRYPQAQIAAYRPAPSPAVPKGSLWHRLRQRWLGVHLPTITSAAPDRLPEATESAQLLLANLILYRSATPEMALRAWQTYLAPGTPLFFVTFGPDTLKELRPHCDRSWPNFPDMHDLGDLMLRLSYAEPVMDMQFLTVTYQTPVALESDWGSWLDNEESKGRSWLTALTYPVALTLELVFGHAWRPSHPPPIPTDAQPIRWHTQRRDRNP